MHSKVWGMVQGHVQTTQHNSGDIFAHIFKNSEFQFPEGSMFHCFESMLSL
jgi:hypothetical protein